MVTAVSIDACDPVERATDIRPPRPTPTEIALDPLTGSRAVRNTTPATDGVLPAASRGENRHTEVRQMLIVAVCITTGSIDEEKESPSPCPSCRRRRPSRVRPAERSEPTPQVTPVGVVRRFRRSRCILWGGGGGGGAHLSTSQPLRPKLRLQRDGGRDCLLGSKSRSLTLGLRRVPGSLGHIWSLWAPSRQLPRTSPDFSRCDASSRGMRPHYALGPEPCLGPSRAFGFSRGAWPCLCTSITVTTVDVTEHPPAHQQSWTAKAHVRKCGIRPSPL